MITAHSKVKELFPFVGSRCCLIKAGSHQGSEIIISDIIVPPMVDAILLQSHALGMSFQTLPFT
jgi:hypothetical protein